MLITLLNVFQNNSDSQSEYLNYYRSKLISIIPKLLFPQFSSLQFSMLCYASLKHNGLHSVLKVPYHYPYKKRPNSKIHNLEERSTYISYGNTIILTTLFY